MAKRAARSTVQEGRRKLNQYLAALDAGMDPELVATRTRAAQAEIAAAQAVIDRAPTAPPLALSLDDVVRVLEAVWHLPALLDRADIAVRAGVYRSLGIQLTYRREDGAEYLQVSASVPGVDLERVGGGT